MIKDFNKYCLGVVILLLIAFATVFTIDTVNYYKEKNNPGELVVTSRQDNEGINLKMSRLSTTSNSVQVTATVLPSTATNKALEWKLNWTETSSENVSDYVTLSVSTSTLVATLNFVKSFDIPMELVATSKANSNIKASCDVDCYKRTEGFTNVKLNVCIDGNSNFDLTESQDTDYNSLTFNGSTTFASIFTDQKVEINSMTATAVKVGTLDTTEDVSYNIGLSSDLQTLLEARDITFDSNITTLTVTTIKGLLERLITFTDDNKEVIYEALNTTGHWFDVYIIVEDKYSSNKVSDHIDVWAVEGFYIGDYYEEVEPTGITLDKTEVIL